MAPSGITYYCSGSTPCKEITEINIYYTKDDFVTVQMQATQFLLNNASLQNCSSVRRRRKKHGLVVEVESLVSSSKQLRRVDVKTAASSSSTKV